MSTGESEGPTAEWGRRLSTAVVLFHEAVGARMGLSAVDQRALALITREAPVTASRLARLTGLTPGAITGLVDRLERAGHVRRSPDPGDRRRVLIAPAPRPPSATGDPFEALGRDMAAVMKRYDERELAVIADYVRNTVEVLEHQTRRLNDQP